MTTQKRKLTLRLISERLQQLPLLPAAVTELMLMDEESPEFYDKVTELAMSDPGLATRVLQTVNSAANAPISPITDIHQGLIHIGLDKTLQFLSLLSVARVFTPVTATQKSIWQHSIETAHFAEFIATQMEDIELPKGLAYTSGLLHDVGRLVLFEISAKAIDKVDTTGWDSPIELPDVETEILGFTHANVGYVAAKKWGLPNIITEMIHHHHDYDLWSDPKVPPEFTQLITIVQFADFLSVLVEKNPDWREWDNERLEQEIRDFCIRDSWPYLKFPIAPLINSLPDICDECERAMRILHLDNKAEKDQ